MNLSSRLFHAEWHTLPGRILLHAVVFLGTLHVLFNSTFTEPSIAKVATYIVWCLMGLFVAVASIASHRLIFKHTGAARYLGLWLQIVADMLSSIITSLYLASVIWYSNCHCQMGAVSFYSEPATFGTIIFSGVVAYSMWLVLGDFSRLRAVEAVASSLHLREPSP